MCIFCVCFVSKTLRFSATHGRVSSASVDRAEEFWDFFVSLTDFSNCIYPQNADRFFGVDFVLPTIRRAITTMCSVILRPLLISVCPESVLLKISSDGQRTTTVIALTAMKRGAWSTLPFSQLPGIGGQCGTFSRMGALTPLPLWQ